MSAENSSLAASMIMFLIMELSGSKIFSLTLGWYSDNSCCLSLLLVVVPEGVWSFPMLQHDHRCGPGRKLLTVVMIPSYSMSILLSVDHQSVMFSLFLFLACIHYIYYMQSSFLFDLSLSTVLLSCTRVLY